MLHLNDEIDADIYSRVNSEHKFLDYGSGGGDYLITRSKNFNIGIGIDISETLVETANIRAKEMNIDNISFAVMDAMNTSFSDEEFDAIRGSGILHHLDIALCLTEIKRILKNDGTAYFIEPLNTNPLIRFYRKRTPEARTIDEQPLRIKDIKLIKTIFPDAEIRFYSFLTLLLVPLRNQKCFPKLLSFLSAIDNIILNKFGPLR